MSKPRDRPAFPRKPDGSLKVMKYLFTAKYIRANTATNTINLLNKTPRSPLIKTNLLRNGIFPNTNTAG